MNKQNSLLLEAKDFYLLIRVTLPQKHVFRQVLLGADGLRNDLTIRSQSSNALLPPFYVIVRS